MNPRDYQAQCVTDAVSALRDKGSALGVLFTGGGKTNILSWIVGETCKMPGSRALLIAHRRELIHQMAQRVHQLTGFDVGIEMGDMRVMESGIYRPKVVVATVQTMGSEARRRKFKGGFDLVVTDEAHHATSRSYIKATQPFIDEGAAHFGTTATPDRMDKVGLGNIFDTCCFDLSMRWGIENGWLAPVRQQFVEVKGLDYSQVKVTAGDLNQKQLGAIVEEESILHQMAVPAMEVAAGRKMIVFCVSIRQAREMAHLFNRYQPGTAAFVSGKTPHSERDDIFDRLRSGELRTLVNVGVATEGFDDPGIEVVAIARATRSRPLMEQMVGRGTRPLPGVVDGPPTIDDRRDAIARSAKPHMTVLDFVGDAGSHPLVHAADVLAGKGLPKRVPDRASKKASDHPDEGETDASFDVLEALLEAEREDWIEQQELERKRREQVKIKAEYVLHEQDPFGGSKPKPVQPKKIPRHWYRIKPSDKQKQILERRGFDTSDVKTMAQASKLFDSPTPADSHRLASNGILVDGLSFSEARAIVKGLNRRGRG